MLIWSATLYSLNWAEYTVTVLHPIVESNRHESSIAKLLFHLLLRAYFADEIADALNISHSSVSGRLKRGKEKLKNMLEGRELDE